MQESAEKSVRKYGSAIALGIDYGGDALKIFVVFMQMTSSFPSTVPGIVLPQIWRDFMGIFWWANFDVLGLLGLDCVGEHLDYRAEVALACALPVSVVLCAGIMHLRNTIVTEKIGQRGSTEAGQRHIERSPGSLIW